MNQLTLYELTGLKAILEELTPRTPWGREQKRLLHPLPPEEGEALSALWRDVETALAFTRPQRVYGALLRFREIRGTVERLRSSQPLYETELFELKRFLLLEEELQAALGEDAAPECFTPPDLTGALAVLDPSGRGDMTFSLSDGDEELRSLVKDCLQAAPDGEAALALERAQKAAMERMTEALRGWGEDLLRAAEAIGALDLALAKADLARRHGGVRPELCPEGLELLELRLPVIPGFVPLSLDFPRGATVLTGANMGGKSTALSAVYCAVWMALSGLYPFAQRAATPHFESVLAMLGAAPDLGGLSDFASQARDFTAMLKADRGQSLLLMDEPARGTNPEEGAAIVQALTLRLNQSRSVSVLSTHFSGAAELAGKHYRAKGLRCGAASLAEAADYGFEAVSGNASPPRDALTVLRLMGGDGELIAAAEKLVDKNSHSPI